MFAKSYDKLPSESNHCGDVELNDCEQNTVVEDDDNQFNLRILYKESVVNIQNPELNTSSTIHKLKEVISAACNVSPQQQRLVSSGRLLRPEDKDLSYFKITSGSTIHLFPIPEVVAVTVPTNQTSANAAGLPEAVINPLTFALAGGRPRDVVLPVHFSPNVAQHAREVKMWSFVLVFVSAMSTINGISFFFSSQISKVTTFDTFILIFETACGFAGLYIGGLGLDSTRSYNIDIIRYYVKNLSRLAIASIILRILWAIDIIIDVKIAVKRENERIANEPTDPDEPTQPIGNDVIQRFEMQTALICLVCVFAWLNCVTRAVQLRNAVLAFNDRPVAVNV